jgi:Uma2 family endonuclease
MVVCSPFKSRNYVEKAPSVIFEILSPATKKKDRTQKYELYEEHGVKYYCIVEPAGMFAEVYALEEGRYAFKGEFKTGTFDFQLDECEVSFDFETLFKNEDDQ